MPMSCVCIYVYTTIYTALYTTAYTIVHTVTIRYCTTCAIIQRIYPAAAAATVAAAVAAAEALRLCQCRVCASMFIQ